MLLHTPVLERSSLGPALIGDDSLTISFEKLSQLVVALGARITGAGVNTSAVGLSAEPNCASVVALLAILHAGYPYVPLDPQYPVARLQYMVADSAVGLLVVVGADAAASTASWFTGCALHVYGDGADGLLKSSTSVSAQAVPASDASVHGARRLAYVMYTSGSTGKPKGVAGSHGAMGERLEAGARCYPYEPGEVGCHKTSLNFVDSICEVLLPLRAGGALSRRAAAPRGAPPCNRVAARATRLAARR